ncbi:MAG: hypothetical protein Q8S73_26670 [Deltaproteobacteria bacterium]|nr:hypothetical protein [Myxococcales bacterium]MDP3217720.1 hypothetical protein [Deltaproteobacteria bacterium]
MTPTLVLSLIAIGITGAGILVQLGRVLSKLDEIDAAQKEIRRELRETRDSLDRVRSDVALGQRDHEHLRDHVDTMGGHVARLELRVDATPHHGSPVARTSRP